MPTCLRLLALVLGSLLAPGCNCGGKAPPAGGDGDIVDASGDAVAADSGPDALPPECASPADCDQLYGPPPCGTWECRSGQCQANCPGCTDADGDGYGVETMPGACAGPDCDDADDTVFDSFQRSCYGGPSGTAGVGTCRAGTETCLAGVVGPCTGEVLPSAEACNAEDDDCDAQLDEGLGTFTCGVGACTATVAACTLGTVGTCTPGAPAANDVTCDGVDDDCDGAIDENCPNCVTVATTGNDTTAAANGNATPFLSIQAAINWAAADPTRARVVCVANGPACAAGPATYNGAVTMADGIHVYGGYESTLFTRCGNNVSAIVPGVALGVHFPPTVYNPTALDGFRIDRALTTTTAAVTVDGAQNAILSNLLINNLPAVTNSYAINVINAATVLIMRNNIFAGNGTGESIGVRSVGSTVTIRENCQSLDAAGHCVDFCGTTNRGIRGRFAPGTGISHSVLLDNSPGSLVESSAMCGQDADVGEGIKIVGDGTGIVIRANIINNWGPIVQSAAISMEDCNGAAPWIVDNEYIAAAGDTVTTQVDGIRAVGDCHPVIDSNELITGGGEGGTSGANGVHCAANAGGVASQCVVLGNLLIQGSDFGFPPTAVGVRCDDDGCNRIAGNVITGRGGVNSWGVYLGRSGTVIENNEIRGGCASMSATGVYLEDSFARLENNRISGGSCTGPGGGGAGTSIGLLVRAEAGGNEVDVHSNVIDARGYGGGCTGAGIRLDVGSSPPSAGKGIYRNNILLGGNCNTRYIVEEFADAADPRILENNDFDPANAPPLYFDSPGTSITMIGGVNGLIDCTVSNNISAPASFVSYPNNLHITNSSPCVGAGTAAGSPAVDMDGDPRDPVAPDIGADEL